MAVAIGPEATWVCDGCAGANPAGTRFCGHCGRPAAGAPAAPPAPPAQRRLVTALFADISGFTELTGRLDPDEVAEVIDRVVRSLADVVGRHDGWIEKYAGDALLALFGAPRSHEDDAERALAVALDMHETLDALRPALPAHARHLQLHVGVNSGHGIARIIGNELRTDYAVLGDALNVAQRLESAAPPRETYVGDLTRRLVRGGFALERLEPLTLKGKPEPVPAWRLAGRRTRTGDGAPPLGREAELDQLRTALARLADGRGGAVLVVGEAGAGKSTLVDAFRADAGGHDLPWLEAWAPSDAGGGAYAPVLDLLARVAGQPTAASPASWAPALAERLAALGLGTAAAPLLMLAGVPDPALADLEPVAFRRELAGALRSLVAAAGRNRPAVLRVEDLHWADDDSLSLVADLAAAAPDTPFLLLATARSEAASVPAALGDTRLLELGPLGDADLAALAQRVAGVGPSPAAVAALQTRSGGNPLFASELVRSLLEAGEPLEAAARAGAEGLPPTVERVLAARLDRLPPTARATAEVAAAIGDEVPLALLEAVAADVGELGAAVDALLEVDLLDPGQAARGVVEFRHALVRDAAYGRLPRRRARALHERIAGEAEALWGDTPDTLDLRARHLHLAGAGARAAAALLAAADRAERVYAVDAAMTHLRHALEHLDAADPAAAEVTLRLADLHELRGEFAEAEALYAAQERGPLAVRAVAGRAASLRKRGGWTEALAALDASLTGAGGADAGLLLLERGRILMVHESFGAAIEAFGRGLDAAPGDAAAVPELLLDLALAEASAGGERLASAREHAEAAVVTLRTRADIRRQATALRILGGIEDDLGRPDEAAVALREGLALARRIGRVEEIGACLLNLGVVELGRGDAAEAAACARRAAAELERIGHRARAAAYANLGEALLQTGDAGGARAMCDRAIEVAEELGDKLTVADAHLTGAQVELARGRPAAAAAEADLAAAGFAAQDAGAWAEKARMLAAEARAAVSGTSG